MKHAPVRHRIEHVLFRGARRFLCAGPPAAVRRRGRRLGHLAHALLGSKRRLARENVALALPELGEDERRDVVRDCFAHYGAYFCELLAAEKERPDDVAARTDVDGWHHLDAARDATRPGRGLFFLATHVGAFEMMLPAIHRRLGTIYAVARPVDNPHVERDVRRLRAHLGAELIPKAGAGHRMLNAHRKGRHVAILIDQHVRESAGIRLPLFGHPAWTSPVLAFLSLHTRSPVVPVYCRPEGDERYRVTIRPPIPPLDARGPEAEAQLTRTYLAEVERAVRVEPSMWLWMHRRWRD